MVSAALPSVIMGYMITIPHKDHVGQPSVIMGYMITILHKDHVGQPSVLTGNTVCEPSFIKIT